MSPGSDHRAEPRSKSYRILFGTVAGLPVCAVSIATIR